MTAWAWVLVRTETGYGPKIAARTMTSKTVAKTPQCNSFMARSFRITFSSSKSESGAQKRQTANGTWREGRRRASTRARDNRSRRTLLLADGCRRGGRQPLCQLCLRVIGAQGRPQLLERGRERAASFFVAARREQRPTEREVGPPKVARLCPGRDSRLLQGDRTRGVGPGVLGAMHRELEVGAPSQQQGHPEGVAVFGNRDRTIGIDERRGKVPLRLGEHGVLRGQRRERIVSRWKHPDEPRFDLGEHFLGARAVAESAVG